MHLLSVSTRFKFAGIRSLSISALSKSFSEIRPLDQFRLSVTYDVADWLRPACANIVAAHDPPDVNDFNNLPAIFVLIVCRARELFHSHGNWKDDTSSNIYPRITPKQSAYDIIKNQLDLLGVEVDKSALVRYASYIFITVANL